jgi:hypothetical protein
MVLVASTTIFAESTQQFRIKMVDPSGAPFPDVLVIVKSLETGQEISRALTTSAGTVPVADLSPGTYRIIATCPYGICATRVAEFLVEQRPLDMTVKLDVLPTQGNVWRVGSPTSLQVMITDQMGLPVPSAEILARDPEAKHEHWYKTDAKGEADIKLEGSTTTVVVFHHDVVVERTISASAASDLAKEHKAFTVQLK